MFTAVSGLRIHQTKMDVIAHNIANVNTAGFKSSRVTFAEVFSQTLGAASGPNPLTNRGGVNPKQIGLGANVASIDKQMTQGAAQRTDAPFDLMIQGDSFFIVSDGSGDYFTRSGAFTMDKEGNVVNPQGMKLQGWEAIDDPANPGRQIVTQARVSDIFIGPDKQYIGPRPTDNVNLYGNINPSDTSVITRSVAFYDSLGSKYVVDMKIQYSGAGGIWDYQIGPDGFINGDRNALITDLIPGGGLTGTLEFDTNGRIIVPGGAPGVPPSIDIPIDNTLTNPPSTFGTGGLNFVRLIVEDLTQFMNEVSTAKTDTMDGNAPGSLSGIGIGSDGKITGRYSNGATRTLAQISVADFKNNAGLEAVGNNLFVQTSNSGSFDGIGQDVTAGGGSMQGGVLEMSNVDLSAEFTEMITTQRGFQANSRVITTSDDMLQELVNLRR
jgi:flagellar hook protein FlgE